MDSRVPPPDLPESMARGHETRDVRVRPVLVFLLLLVATIGGSTGFLVLLMTDYERQAEREDAELPPTAAARRDAPPAPRLQTSAQAEMRALRARQEARLAAAEWIDEQAGIARIPIDRAIEIVVEQGLPKWPSAEDSP